MERSLLMSPSTSGRAFGVLQPLPVATRGSVQFRCGRNGAAACRQLDSVLARYSQIQTRSRRRRVGVGAASPATQNGVQEGLPVVERSAGAASTSVTDEAEVLIEIRDVHKSFGSKEILKGASIKIRRGEAVGIIGGSGTGKSTTLRLMAGLLAPDQGDVIILGKKRKGLLMDDPELVDRMKIGLVFQNGALFDSLTVGENVGFQLIEHTTLPPDRIKELVAESLASVGLSGVEGLYPSELSGGMRKRVALARAIVKDDEHSNAEQVIMYDEPTAGLDPVASTVVEDLIRSLHNTGHGAAARNGNGVAQSARSGISSYIVVTHQHSTIRRAVDRIIFLNAGQVVWEGTVAEFDTTDEPIVRQFASGSLDGPIKYE